MTPGRCGTGCPLSALEPADRQAVEEFTAFLRGELAYDTATNEYVDPSEAASNPAVVMSRSLRSREEER